MNRASAIPRAQTLPKLAIPALAGRGFEGDDQVASIGKMLLVNPEFLGYGKPFGEEIQNFDIQAQASKADQEGEQE